MRRRTVQLALLAATGAALVLQVGPTASSAPEKRLNDATKQASAAYGNLPLAFTANAGETDSRVRYSAQAGGLSVFFTRKEAMLALQRPRKGVALALRFLGSNPNVAIGGERPESGRVNYLIGNDPAKWRTGLRTYERVVYRNLWPGVDVVFAGQNGKLKYEFLVRPGARASEIRLAYRGAKRLSLDRQGTCASAHRSASSPTRGRRATSSSPISECPYEVALRSSLTAGVIASWWSRGMTTATRSSSIPVSPIPPTWGEAATTVATP
jgi:hypothetical protein